MRAVGITLTNETEEYTFSDHFEPLSETHMGEDATMGAIYRAARAEYGRCKSKVFYDCGDETVHVGWFFVRRTRYQDVNEFYLQGAWVTVGEHIPAVPERLAYCEET